MLPLCSAWLLLGVCVCCSPPGRLSRDCASSTCGQRGQPCPAAGRATSSSPWLVLPPPSLLLATPPPAPACRAAAHLTPAHLLLPPVPWQKFPFSKLNLGTKHNSGHRWSMGVLQDAPVTGPALPMPANYKSDATS